MKITTILLCACVIMSAGCSSEQTDPDKAVTKVAVTPANPALTVGGTVNLEADLRDDDDSPTSDGENTVTWQSSNPAIATVVAKSNAAWESTLTGIAVGSATITASCCGGIKGTTVVTVTSIQNGPTWVLDHIEGSESANWSDATANGSGRLVVTVSPTLSSTSPGVAVVTFEATLTRKGTALKEDISVGMSDSSPSGFNAADVSTLGTVGATATATGTASITHAIVVSPTQATLEISFGGNFTSGGHSGWQILRKAVYRKQ